MIRNDHRSPYPDIQTFRDLKIPIFKKEFGKKGNRIIDNV